MTPDPRVVRTRARALNAAWEVLQEVGFDGVTVEPSRPGPTVQSTRRQAPTD